MNLLEGVSIAIESLRGHKLRTFLTLLGNIVGTMSVLAVVSLIYGADRYVSQVVLDEGTSVFTLTRVDGIQFLTDFDAFLESLNNPNVTLADRDWLSGRITTAGAVGAYAETTGDLRADGQLFRSARRRWGVGLKRWLDQQRLQRAELLINQGGRRTTEVAQAVGYRSVQVLNRRLRNWRGGRPAGFNPNR